MTGTHPTLQSILPPEERHIIQFDIGRESFIVSPTCERDRDIMEREIIAAGIQDYTIRTLAHYVDETGKLSTKWFDVRSKGSYAS